MDDSFSHDIRMSVRELIADSSGLIEASTLEEFGWSDLAGEEPQLAISTLFEELGRKATASQAINALVSFLLIDAVSSPADFFSPGGPELNSLDDIAVGESIDIDGFATIAGNCRELVIVQAARKGGAVGIIAQLGSGQVAPAQGVDAGALIKRISGSVVVSHVLDATHAAATLLGVRRAIGYEQLGLAKGMLAVAVEHVTSREQFGRPIGSYQAVQHRLAEVHVSIVSAAAALGSSWSVSEDQLSLAVSVGFVEAARAASVAMRECMQVCGGMALTEEFALAPLIRRSLMLEGVYERASSIEQEIGTQLCSQLRAPRIAQFSSETL